MFKIKVSPNNSYPRSISYSNRIEGLLKMILGSNPASFNNGSFEVIINCNKLNLINLINLLRIALKKQFLDSKTPYYELTWEELK